ncbi:2-phosphosulfolactate phosphatase [Ferroacidibacillus organovorans]|uniref:Probable 2-phosphosulfolactate phosphatase n=1 Tax=Ferroacidibacillus organovorans TaxID=1765683 RepID=A0A162UWF6_9BACL|nr:2-phosphosulfolactate phosphatase [Ferroacidibacillus organovorans]KYP82086.1 hypothetical protein AYJ22_00025 [Ferroacidibacillus organovorans]OAG91284.1 hypothetical protein AYW79_13830 [Ferroacidibacillus organovorans]OPG15628.1 hypothetical protein B2M26_11255 [Ferroacidibacillus organovorans]
MNIEIVQGNGPYAPAAGVHVVIDVIRAFTVAQVAFIGGAKEIVLARDKEQAFALRERRSDALLAGEIAGLAVPGFDLDNSPAGMAAADVAGRSIIQMTTNGVKAAVQALAAEHVLVTGFSNAKQTASFVQSIAPSLECSRIRLIASHPTSDDDLACAEYIESILASTTPLSAETVATRIRSSVVAQKFYDQTRPEFDEKDMEWCAREIPCPFVMRVTSRAGIPVVERVDV